MDRKKEKGPEKVGEICTILRNEALEPAKRESKEIIKDAQNQAQAIIHEAEKKAEKLIAVARQSIEQEHNVFKSSLTQAAKQTLETLRQDIENKLFNSELQHAIEKQTSDPKVIAQLINAICASLENEGLSTDLAALIPKHVSVQAVNQLLLGGIVSKLKEQSVVVGNFSGGAKVKLINKNMTIDLSDEALKELLANYIRKDFRKLIFES